VSANGKTVSKTVAVEQDPRITVSSDDRAKRREAITKLYVMARQADEGRRKIVAVRTSLVTVTDAWKRPSAPAIPAPVKQGADDLLAKIKADIGTFEFEREGPLGAAGPPLKYTPPPVNQRITRLLNGLDSYSGAPTARQLADIQSASVTLVEGLAKVKKITEDDLPRLNKMMAEAGVPYITADVPPAPGQERRGR